MQQDTSITDSVWFWLALFLTAALFALVLTVPKYSWRQPQLERQYQARERSGVTISAADGPGPLSQPGRPMIRLRPLFMILSLALLLCSCGFWLQRVRQRKEE